MNTLNTLTKRILSYFKSTWNFHDYPIRTWRNPNAQEDKVRYGAGIIGWVTMIGHGTTAEDAITTLYQSFKLYQENNKLLPRPGTKVQLQFASTEHISKYEDLAVDFFQRILEMDYYEGFYSDGSYLDLFASENSEKDKTFKNLIIKKTLLIYNVDITDVYDKALWEVFRKIEDNR